MAEEHKNTQAEEQSVFGGIDIDIFKYDVRVFLISLRRRLPLLILIPIFICAMTIAYVYTMPKTWKATCILFKSNPETTKEGELSTLRRPLSVDVIKEMIRTKENMRAVIKNLKLSASMQGLYGATSISVPEDNENMINVTALSEFPDQAANIANELSKVFLENYTKIRNSTVQKRFDYFSHQKIMVMDELRTLEEKKKAYLARHGVTSEHIEKSLDIMELDEVEDEIALAEQKKNALEIAIKECKEKINKLEPEVKLSYEVTTVDDTALVLKKNELETLRQRYTDINPKVKKVIAEIKVLEKKMKMEKAQKAKRPARKITYGKNWQLTRIEEQIFQAETELKSTEFKLQKHQLKKDKIEKRMLMLKKSAEEYNELNRKISLQQELLKKIDKGVTEMSLALSSNVSDLRIFEKAEPPVYPTVDKRRKILVFGGLIGVILAGICAVFLEIIDLTIKSKFEIENVLRVEALGSLPKINEVRLKKFYSAVQIVFTRIFKSDIKADRHNVLIAFGDVEGGTGKTFFIKKCIDIFGPMDKRILYISSCSELASGLVKYKVNDYIYNNQAVDPDLAAENNDHLYFLLDNYSYIVPISPKQIEEFINSFTEYDFIFWELFEFRKNEPLFANICSVASSTVLLAKFKKTKKMAMVKCVKHLREHGVKKIGAVVNSVEKRYFNKGI
jgi:capsular polysaccharide biosynthesis protein